MTVEPRSIRRVLVANRGEIAVRIIDACRDLGIEAVGVYAEPDRDAPHVELADAAVALEGTVAAETYLNQAKLLDAALTQRCDAVHPGYGFLAESAAFARAVLDAGLTWIGPHPEAIAQMGDKLAAKRLAAGIGVPTLPSVELAGDAAGDWQAQAASVGYPLLVKAAAGGGGRGMRLVSNDEELAEAVPSARREAEGSFGDGTVFAERWLAAPRHIEVQVVGDRHGTVIHLGERECSIQRRHQKIIEEAPSPAVDHDLRQRLGDAATALAGAIAYDNVGTVEFLLDDATGEFYFLEMNTRIQVEHRVTEWLAGCDLVALQIESARGEALSPELDSFDVDRHAIEARLYAEDPSQDWLPSTGTVHRFESGWVLGGETDAGIRNGSTVSAHYDPLLAKVIASGASRAQAIGRLVQMLRSTVVHGIDTNCAYLISVLEHPDFVAGLTTTLFVADHPDLVAPQPDDELIRAHLLATALSAMGISGPGAPWSFAPLGWRNVGTASVDIGLEQRGVTHAVSYRLGTDGSVSGTIDGVAVTGRVLRDSTDGREGLTLEVDGVARRFLTHHVGDTWYVNSTLGQTDLVECPRFGEASATADEGGPTAPVPGRIVAVQVAVGDVVETGQVLAVLEAMKVEHQIRSHRAAIVTEVLVAPGDTVDAHQLLIRLEEAVHG